MIADNQTKQIDLKGLCGELKAMLISVHDPAKTGLSFSAFLPPESIFLAAQKMYEWGFFLEDINGLDVSEGLMVVYHFNLFAKGNHRVAFRVMTSHENPEIPSIYDIYHGAEWHEREAYDFYGIIFTGNPNLLHLLLPGEFHGDPPLLKKPEKRSSIAGLGLIGEAEFLNDTWAKIFKPPHDSEAK